MECIGTFMFSICFAACCYLYEFLSEQLGMPDDRELKRATKKGEITVEDKQLARAAWAHVEKDYAATGDLLFRELFNTYPDYVRYFEKLRSRSDQDLLESPRFRRHMVSALFPALAALLADLDRPDRLAAALTGIGVNHKKRGLTRTNFEALHKIIISTFKKALGDEFTAETEAAWNKILGVIMDNISNTIEQS